MSALILPFPQVRPAPETGSFTVLVMVNTAAPGYYVGELMAIDPDAELEDGCEVVYQLKNGDPRTARWFRTRGRDRRGRYLPPGDPREACYLDEFGFRYCAGDKPPSFIRILGRVAECRP